jgi:hypothetical protein
MKYDLQRDGEVYELEISYDLVRGAHASSWGVASGEMMADYPVLESAWLDGKVFPLTDAEIADAEDWICGQL